jgi:hypothetical protein
VAVGGVTGDIGRLDGGLYAQLAAGGGVEVAALGLDPGRSPVARVVPERGDLQVPVAVLQEVGGIGGEVWTSPVPQCAAPPG